MNRNIFALQRIARRTFSSSGRRLENHVPQKQKRFQENDGMPIHLKGGVSDSLLYRATMGITVLGGAYVVYELVKWGCPKKA